MVKAPKEFLIDLKTLFDKYDVHLAVWDGYDGVSIEIKSNYNGADSLPIYIDDIRALELAIDELPTMEKQCANP